MLRDDVRSAFDEHAGDAEAAIARLARGARLR
jgi:hypothetical protein